MTIILAAETELNRFMIALSFPLYQPSILLGVIAALLLALLGLAVDAVLFPTAIGTTALGTATIAAGVVWGLAFLELWRAGTVSPGTTRPAPQVVWGQFHSAAGFTRREEPAQRRKA